MTTRRIVVPCLLLVVILMHGCAASWANVRDVLDETPDLMRGTSW